MQVVSRKCCIPPCSSNSNIQSVVGGIIAEHSVSWSIYVTVNCYSSFTSSFQCSSRKYITDLECRGSAINCTVGIWFECMIRTLDHPVIVEIQFSAWSEVEPSSWTQTERNYLTGSSTLCCYQYSS